jgi:phosphonate degradation associated HDIG domain protein
MSVTVGTILSLYSETPVLHCGHEQVNQTEHALQCAQFARTDGAGVELVAAAFLHDIGHLIVERPRFVGPEIDDLHQYVGLPPLRALFGAAVLEPIRLHVDAKRYLCHAEPRYWERLSPASRRSLELQGGAFSACAASVFLGRRFARDAIRLRRWDDAAKVPGRPVPELADMTALLESAAGCHKTAMAGA